MLSFKCFTQVCSSHGHIYVIVSLSHTWSITTWDSRGFNVLRSERELSTEMWRSGSDLPYWTVYTHHSQRRNECNKSGVRGRLPSTLRPKSRTETVLEMEI